MTKSFDLLRRDLDRRLDVLPAGEGDRILERVAARLAEEISRDQTEHHRSAGEAGPGSRLPTARTN